MSVEKADGHRPFFFIEAAFYGSSFDGAMDRQQTRRRLLLAFWPYFSSFTKIAGRRLHSKRTASVFKTKTRWSLKKGKKFSRFRSTGGFNWPQFWWKCGGSHLLLNLIKVYFQIQMGHQILCRKNRKLILAHGTTTKSDYVILAINVPYVFVNAHFLFRFFFHLV